MTSQESRSFDPRLAPALGLVAGVVIGILLASLDVVSAGWAIAGGAALGLIVGAVVATLSSRR